jgi:S1-C subfamily serine protease
VPDEYARRARIVGAVLMEVQAGTPAYEAGLRGVSRDRYGRTFVNDVITAVDKTPVKSYDDLFTALEGLKIGDKVALTVERNDQTRKVVFTLVRD